MRLRGRKRFCGKGTNQSISRNSRASAPRSHCKRTASTLQYKREFQSLNSRHEFFVIFDGCDIANTALVARGAEN